MNYIVLKSYWFGSHLDSKQKCAQATMLSPPEAPLYVVEADSSLLNWHSPKSSLGVGASLKHCVCSRKLKQPVHSNQTGLAKSVMDS